MLLLLALRAWGGEPDQIRYLLVHPGDDWVYDGTLRKGGFSMKTTLHRRIGEKVSVNGKEYFRAYDTVPAGSASELLRRDETGLYSLEDGGTEEQPYGLLPWKPGQTWTTRRKRGTSTFTVIGVETVAVGEKSYTDCIRIREVREAEYVQDFWEAPDVGCVKMEMKNADGSVFVFTLQKFTPGFQAKQ
jgi:hypothetical protein